MIKVMVAEDELPLLRGIKSMIESINPRFKVAMSAKNGREAADYLEDNQVDVLFTDINMPMMDGLSLIKHIAGQGKKIQTVIISGYNDFSYARQALRYGVKNYLLKPVDKGELEEVLKDLQREYEQNSYEGKNRSLSEALFGNPEGDAEPLFEEEITALYFCAGSLTSDMTEELTPGNEFWGKNNLKELACEVWGDRNGVFCFFGKSLNEMILLLEGTGGKNIKNIAAEILSKLNASLPVAVAYADPVCDIGRLKNICHLLRKMIRKKSVFGATRLVNTEPEREKFVLDLARKAALEFALKNQPYESIRQMLLELKEQMKQAEISQKNLEDILREILISLYQQRPEIKDFEFGNLESDISDLIAYSNSLDNVFDDFLELCKNMMQGKSYEGGHEIMIKVDEYIRSHIAMPLTTKMLAARFGLVAPYLSKLFKNYKGETPSQYIQNIRISNAKELLSSYPDMLAKDVAEMVGYSNPLYFSKTFKKNVGVYPSDFRTQNKI